MYIMDAIEVGSLIHQYLPLVARAGWMFTQGSLPHTNQLLGEKIIQTCPIGEVVCAQNVVYPEICISIDLVYNRDYQYQ